MSWAFKQGQRKQSKKAKFNNAALILTSTSQTYNRLFYGKRSDPHSNTEASLAFQTMENTKCFDCLPLKYHTKIEIKLRVSSLSEEQ